MTDSLQFSSLITAEEHQVVMEKMVDLVQSKPGHFSHQDELYLEQQLQDLLGFEVVAELEGHRLPQTVGTMAALPHLRRYPTDTLKKHDTCQEAGWAAVRSGFGWFTELGQLTSSGVEREKYHFAIHADFLSSWDTDRESCREWFKFRKMVMVNPIAKRAVVGVVGDVGPSDWMQYQFGGSPEVVRQGRVWDLDTQGHVLLLFVNDPDDRVPLGPQDLGAIEKNFKPE